MNENFKPLFLNETGQAIAEELHNISEKLGGGASGGGMVSITYAQLKALRDNGQLVAGTSYRITDYECTTTQGGTQSAGHPFDIIVVADDASTLNENARAIQHEGDEYFNNANLSAWELKYCLDNDTERFVWADANGKGVIYYMKDEWNNECPYDFKNIQFKRRLTDGAYDPDEGDDTYVYTFNWYTEGGECWDTSVKGNDGSLPNDEGQIDGGYGNVIKPRVSYDNYPENPTSSTMWLNNIVFLNDYDFDGGSFYGCYSNAFGNNCYSNTFGNDCSSNAFGNDCSSNAFGNDCSYNAFGNDCSYNAFGNSCSSNAFGNDCSYNAFGNSCSYNAFGNDCSSNAFGNDCSHDTFGNSCSHNTFGNSCSSNTFGNDCDSNAFGNSSAISYCRYIDLGDGVHCCKIYGTTTTSYSKYLQNVRVAQGLKGTSGSNKLAIEVATNLAYETYVGKNTSGTLVIKNLLD